MASEGRPRIVLEAAVLTDVGVVRDHNEDSAHVDPENQFFIVADGMGGHAAGEVASAMAVDRVRQALEADRDVINAFAAKPSDDGRKKLVALLETSVRDAHKAVYDRGVRETDKHGMGTTLDVVVVAGPEAFVAHVGDSRTYLIRDTRAAQITTDHTVAEVLVIEGKLSLEEAQISPLRTILVNAIGVAADVGIEMAHVQLRQDDHLLLCSDGLHDYFPMEQELADCISKIAPTESIAELVTQAKERGGHDNITGIVVRVVECHAPTRIAPKSPEQMLAEEVTATLPIDAINQAVSPEDKTLDREMDDETARATTESEDDEDDESLGATIDRAIADHAFDDTLSDDGEPTPEAEASKADGTPEANADDAERASDLSDDEDTADVDTVEAETAEARVNAMDLALGDTDRHQKPTAAEIQASAANPGPGDTVDKSELDSATALYEESTLEHERPPKGDKPSGE